MRRKGSPRGERTGGIEAANADSGDLEMRVVEYPDAPDRCTIYPPEVSDHERLTHWLSADRDAFLAIDQWR